MAVGLDHTGRSQAPAPRRSGAPDFTAPGWQGTISAWQGPQVRRTSGRRSVWQIACFGSISGSALCSRPRQAAFARAEAAELCALHQVETSAPPRHHACRQPCWPTFVVRTASRARNPSTSQPQDRRIPKGVDWRCPDQPGPGQTGLRPGVPAAPGSTWLAANVILQVVGSTLGCWGKCPPRQHL